MSFFGILYKFINIIRLGVRLKITILLYKIYHKNSLFLCDKSDKKTWVHVHIHIVKYLYCDSYTRI